jgi:hypothetical protein
VSTREVHNSFTNKKILTPEDSDYEEAPHQGIPPAEQDDHQSTAVWLHSLFDKNKDPEPLFVLDLILKPGHLIPTYSTHPDEVINKVLGVFDEGIEALQ